MMMFFRHKKIARPFEGSGDVFIVCFLAATGQAKRTKPLQPAWLLVLIHADRDWSIRAHVPALLCVTWKYLVCIRRTG